VVSYEFIVLRRRCPATWCITFSSNWIFVRPCIYSDFIFNEHYNVHVLWNFGFHSTFFLVISIYKNFRTIVKMWKILFCGARCCVVVCMVSYVFIRVISVCTLFGFVLCLTWFFNKCKKWQHTCGCCSNNLWLLQGTRWHLWPAISLQHFTLLDHRSSPPICSFMCMSCRSLLVLLYSFFWSLCCLFFLDIRILITNLVSSNSSYEKYFTTIKHNKTYQPNYIRT